MGPSGKLGHSLVCSLRTIASLLEETDEGVCPKADDPLSDVLLALPVHPENSGLDIIALTLVFHLLEGCEGIEAGAGLEFEVNPRCTEYVSTLTTCPCRFSIRE